MCNPQRQVHNFNINNQIQPTEVSTNVGININNHMQPTEASTHMLSKKKMSACMHCSGRRTPYQPPFSFVCNLAATSPQTLHPLLRPNCLEPRCTTAVCRSQIPCSSLRLLEQRVQADSQCSSYSAIAMLSPKDQVMNREEQWRLRQGRISHQGRGRRLQEATASLQQMPLESIPLH